MGIEPTALAWEARVLPLYDARGTQNSIVFQTLWETARRGVTRCRRSSALRLWWAASQTPSFRLMEEED
jgi:hypothetical protein